MRTFLGIIETNKIKKALELIEIYILQEHIEK